MPDWTGDGIPVDSVECSRRNPQSLAWRDTWHSYTT